MRRFCFQTKTLKNHPTTTLPKSLFAVRFFYHSHCNYSIISKNPHKFKYQPIHTFNTNTFITMSNSKKRSLKDMQNDDSDDEDLQQDQPESAPKKKRKLNNTDAQSEEDDDLSEEDTKPTKTKKKSSSPMKAAPFKICCYNLNGVRAAAKNGLEEYLEEGMNFIEFSEILSLSILQMQKNIMMPIYLEDADIVCFSEMKAKLSQNPCTFRGYEVCHQFLVQNKNK